MFLRKNLSTERGCGSTQQSVTARTKPTDLLISTFPAVTVSCLSLAAKTHKLGHLLPVPLQAF